MDAADLRFFEAVARHGFAATPPKAIRTSAILPSTTSSPAATETSAKA